MPMDTPPNPSERAGYRLDFEDTFDGPDLDLAKWWPYDMPHWSSRAASKARYEIGGGALTLFIAEDQKPAKPDEGDIRSSCFQTGQFSGPLGGTVGQHHYQPGLTVLEEQPTKRLYLPRYGFIEMRARMDLGPDDLAALWTIGFEEGDPDQSGEITVCEVFGKGIEPGAAEISYGIKPITDPKLKTGDFHVDRLPFDPADFHIYAAEWTPNGVSFFFDNKKLREVAQSPDYPMQLMMGVYALPQKAPSSGRRKLPRFTVDYVRGYSRVP